MKKKILVSALVLVMVMGLFSACGDSGEGGTAAEFRQVYSYDVATLNYLNTTSTGDMAIPANTQEWLIQYDNVGNVLPAVAEDWKTSDDGLTWTFTLRDMKWYNSAGEEMADVTAQDFVFSWQRLVTPETAADYSYMIDCVVGASEIIYGTATGELDEEGNEIMEHADPSTLAVKAVDDKTFEVTITSDLPYFLEICAFPATFPVRSDIVSNAQWTYDPATYISNGAYKMTVRETNSQIVMEPNEYYYDVASLGPQKITFKLMEDQNAMLNGFKTGELDFIESMPVDEIAGLMTSGDLKIVDYIGTYYVCYQTQKAPFDDPKVRQAFTLAVDRNYIVSEITQTGQVEAGGYVPAGVYDAAGATGDDFRTTGGDYYDPYKESYEANCEKARELLAEAGYPNGEGFPVVEYLYNTDDNHKAVAEALQNMCILRHLDRRRSGEIDIDTHLDASERKSALILQLADVTARLARGLVVGMGAVEHPDAAGPLDQAVKIVGVDALVVLGCGQSVGRPQVVGNE